MTKIVETLGRPGATVVIVALVAAIVLLAVLGVDVPAALEYLTTALIAGNLYGRVPPHARDGAR